ncbi:MAG: hypothetical protein P9M14_06290 [Candidatus Alcyoniella australis]|nr:hypothetical protein [Candidatus Alcyoniella australis]
MADQSGQGAINSIGRFLKYHLHVALYTYFWFGLFVCGLLAPDDRIRALDTNLISHGWHLSLLSMLLVLPVPIIYLLRMRRPA